MTHKPKDLIVNLTAHVNKLEGVETMPRLSLLSNPKNADEVRDKVKKAIKGVPVGASVLFGGEPNCLGLLLAVAKMRRWKVYYYSSFDNCVYTGAFWSRMDKFEIERDEITD